MPEKATQSIDQIMSEGRMDAVHGDSAPSSASTADVLSELGANDTGFPDVSEMNLPESTLNKHNTQPENHVPDGNDDADSRFNARMQEMRDQGVSNDIIEMFEAQHKELGATRKDLKDTLARANKSDKDIQQIKANSRVPFEQLIKANYPDNAATALGSGHFFQWMKSTVNDLDPKGRTYADCAKEAIQARNHKQFMGIYNQWMRGIRNTQGDSAAARMEAGHFTLPEAGALPTNKEDVELRTQEEIMMKQFSEDERRLYRIGRELYAVSAKKDTTLTPKDIKLFGKAHDMNERQVRSAWNFYMRNSGHDNEIKTAIRNGDRLLFVAGEKQH